MQLKSYFFALIVLLFAVVARAETRVDKYSEYVVPYLNWAQQNPEQRELLNIFPTFAPPDVKFINKYRKEDSRTEVYYTYVTTMKVTIKKGAANLPLAKLIDLKTIQTMDPELKHKRISASEVMTVMAGRTPIPNFNWCNTGTYVNTFAIPQREKDLSYMTNPQRPWCADTKQSVCLETCFYFPAGWLPAIATENQTRKSENKKDFGIAMQSESRYFSSDAEYGSRVDLKQITKLKTPIRGVLEQNVFYFNQIVTWGKVVAIFQEHETNSQLSEMTVLIAFNIRKKNWENARIKEALQGNSLLQGDSGLAAGIPEFSKTTAANIAKALEN